MPARRTQMRKPGSNRARRPSLARRFVIGATTIALLASIGASGVFAGGPPAPAFYVDDVQYRTVGTPTDLFGTGAPVSTYDVIYALGGDLMNVAESKPGDTDYNGGRWLVLPITWADGVEPVQFTNDAEILAAAEAGDLTIGSTPVKSFVCPVIKMPGGHGG
jgi:hypothetical protein